MQSQDERTRISEEKLKKILRNRALEEYTHVGVLTDEEERKFLDKVLEKGAVSALRSDAEKLFKAVRYVYLSRTILMLLLILPMLWVIMNPTLISWLVLVCWICFASWYASLTSTHFYFCADDIRDTLRRIESRLELLENPRPKTKE